MNEKKERLSSKIVEGVKWSYVSAMLSGAFRLLVLSVLAHLLSPREFGLLGIAMIFVNFSERISQVGLGPALVQRSSVTDGHHIAAANTGILTGFLIFGLLWIGSPYIAMFFDEPAITSILKVLSVVFIIEGFSMVPDSVLQRELEFRKLMVVENVSYIIGSGIVSIVLALLGFGVWSLVAGVIVVRVLRAAMLNVMSPQRLRAELRLQETKELLSIGAGFSLGRILNFCALYGDNFVVGRLLGASALGMYTRAYQIMSLPSAYSAQVLDRVLFPALAKKQESKPEIAHAFLQTLEFVSYVSLPFMVMMVLLSDEIVITLLGEKWVGAIPVLRILSLGVFVRTGYKVGDILSRALGAVYAHAYRQAIYTALVIIGAVLGAGMKGLEGVAWGVLVAVTANYVLMLCLSIRLLKVGWVEIFYAHVPALWVSAVMTSAVYLTARVLRETVNMPILTIAGASVAGIAAFLLAVASAPHFCRLRSAQWLLANIPLSKLGAFGGFGTRLLRRQLSVMQES